MRIFLTVTLALIGLSFLACSEHPLESTPEKYLADVSLSAPLLDKSAGPSVHGNGHLIDGEVERTVTFNIVKRADGEVDGWYHALRRGPGGAHIKVDIDCLHVVGNQAWAGGIVVAAVNPVSLAVLKAPAEYGAALAVGEAQPFGINPGWG
ncbi:MAG: hypothetical protein ABFS42_16030, partial [Candidatus Krumholzibacteriota bacterium]